MGKYFHRKKKSFCHFRRLRSHCSLLVLYNFSLCDYTFISFPRWTQEPSIKVKKLIIFYIVMAYEDRREELNFSRPIFVTFKMKSDQMCGFQIIDFVCNNSSRSNFEFTLRWHNNPPPSHFLWLAIFTKLFQTCHEFSQL